MKPSIQTPWRIAQATAIRKRAKRDDWERDMSARIKKISRVLLRCDIRG